jgi:hypothetical protein
MRLPKISRASFDRLVKDMLPALGGGAEGQEMPVQWWIHWNKTRGIVQMGYGEWPSIFFGISDRSA